MSQTNLSASHLQHYRQRWQAVAQQQTREQQNATISERWQQLNALIYLAQSLDILPQPEKQLTANAIRQRWLTLYQHQQANPK
jgi:hypothetical protein